MFFTFLNIVLISFYKIDKIYMSFFYIEMVVCPIYWIVEYFYEKINNNNNEKERKDV
jgi:hypothetical protein